MVFQSQVVAYLTDLLSPSAAQRRYQLFCAHSAQVSQLLPNQDALYKHMF